MKKALTSAILTAIILMVSLPTEAVARYDDYYSVEDYYAKAYWKDHNYSSNGISGENYIYQQNPIQTFWQEFVTEMKQELIIVWPYWYQWRPTYWETAGYYQWGSSYRKLVLRYHMGFGVGPFEEWQSDYVQPGTYHDFTIMSMGSGNWWVFIDGGGRSYVSFPTELDKCNVECMTSKFDYWGDAFSWYDDLRQYQYPYYWYYWDDLHTSSTTGMVVWELGSDRFFTYANPG